MLNNTIKLSVTVISLFGLLLTNSSLYAMEEPNRPGIPCAPKAEVELGVTFNSLKIEDSSIDPNELRKLRTFLKNAQETSRIYTDYQRELARLICASVKDGCFRKQLLESCMLLDVFDKNFVFLAKNGIRESIRSQITKFPITHWGKIVKSEMSEQEAQEIEQAATSTQIDPDPDGEWKSPMHLLSLTLPLPPLEKQSFEQDAHQREITQRTILLAYLDYGYDKDGPTSLTDLLPDLIRFKVWNVLDSLKLASDQAP